MGRRPKCPGFVNNNNRVGSLKLVGFRVLRSFVSERGLAYKSHLCFVTAISFTYFRVAFMLL